MRTLSPLAAVAAATVLLAACASDMTRAERLSLYEAHAGPPMKQMNYFSPQGWEEIDSDHIVVTMRPTEAYLMRLSGPCLDYDNGAAVMSISTQIGGFVQPKFDRVRFGGSNFSCRIEEIRPLDVQGLRAARPAAG